MEQGPKFMLGACAFAKKAVLAGARAERRKAKGGSADLPSEGNRAG